MNRLMWIALICVFVTGCAACAPASTIGCSGGHCAVSLPAVLNHHGHCFRRHVVPPRAHHFFHCRRPLRRLVAGFFCCR
ncbi:hypothetical protein LCGC14_0326330 [marine sediment metagenome]|uniref:Uncharacterized protein n=1 Tax=marine sediment metagenome TaxID=412755 RepID=A0A0F9W597_9ZZZZ